MIFFVILGYLMYRHYRRSRQALQAPEQTQVTVAYDDCKAYAEMLKRRQAEEKQRQLERKQQLKRATALQQAERLELLNMEIDGILYALDKEEKALLKEYPDAPYKRQTQIQARLTVIATKRAATAQRLAMNDNKIDKLKMEAV